MITAVGIDILAIMRFRTLRNKSRFISTVFTEKEIEQSSIYFYRDRIYAALFTLKEAVLKVLRCGLRGGTLWQQIETDHKLCPRISSSLLELSATQPNDKIHVSLGWSRNFALGIALKETEEKSLGGI